MGVLTPKDNDLVLKPQILEMANNYPLWWLTRHVASFTSSGVQLTDVPDHSGSSWAVHPPRSLVPFQPSRFHCLRKAHLRDLPPAEV